MQDMLANSASGTETSGIGTLVRPAASFATRPRRILVVNGKGGCGKTTVATNLAATFAARGRRTVLFDYDPQGSSLQWLSQRKDLAPVHGIAAHRRATGGVTRTWLLRLPAGTERVVLDAPAGVHGADLVELVREVDTILIPVLPSPIDIHAAAHFIEELLLVAKVRARSVRVGIVANRVQEHTRAYQNLERFLQSLSIPFVATLCESESYVHAVGAGMSIGEMPSTGQCEREQWEALLRWLESEHGG